MRIVFWYFVWLYVFVIHLIIERNLIMPKYDVFIHSEQTYVYQVEADNPELAHEVAGELHSQASDPWEHSIDFEETFQTMLSEVQS